MKDKINKTILLIKAQKNKIIDEINKESVDIERSNRLILQITELDEKLKLYYEQLESLDEEK